MRLRNGEAFIPPVCPALKVEDTGLYHGQGLQVDPSNLRVSTEDLRDGHVYIREGDSPDSLLADVYFF